MRAPDSHGTPDEPPLQQPGGEDWIERTRRIATPPTADEHNVLVGMDRPATREELQAFVDREQARIRREGSLRPPT